MFGYDIYEDCMMNLRLYTIYDEQLIEIVLRKDFSCNHPNKDEALIFELISHVINDEIFQCVKTKYITNSNDVDDVISHVSSNVF